MTIEQGDKRKECCRVEENLSPATPLRGGDLTYRQCAVCGCKHYELALDPGKLGIIGRGVH